ncbi:hypothetical protein AGIG_G6040 [Arapaima gigas]
MAAVAVRKGGNTPFKATSEPCSCRYIIAFHSYTASSSGPFLLSRRAETEEPSRPAAIYLNRTYLGNKEEAEEGGRASAHRRRSHLNSPRAGEEGEDP